MNADLLGTNSQEDFLHDIGLIYLWTKPFRMNTTNNPIHATHSNICTHSMYGVQPTEEHSLTAKRAELHNVKPAQF